MKGKNQQSTRSSPNFGQILLANCHLKIKIFTSIIPLFLGVHFIYFDIVDVPFFPN